MRYDQTAIQWAERNAYSILTSPVQEEIKWNEADDGTMTQSRRLVRNKYFVEPLNISAPTELVQELPFINATQVFNFQYDINAPTAQAAPGTNNVILGKNNIMCMYGLKIWQGEGVNANNRIYRSFGLTVNDNSLYNSTISMRFEQSTLMDKIPGQSFRDVYTSPLEWNSMSGMILINPQRIVTGEMGVLTITINLITPINALVLSPNIFLSCRPVIVYGAASAKKRG